ncbi:hypothetical protein [Lentzea kentuckyensis]|uniref:hypothetical protein n=1 Tax=Lentzea kentuckyensis TaxID=360086 RepID=UPI000A370ECE|nr:hypothetical protein [Lentzea kentuckyensis]
MSRPLSRLLAIVTSLLVLGVQPASAVPERPDAVRAVLSWIDLLDYACNFTGNYRTPGSTSGGVVGGAAVALDDALAAMETADGLPQEAVHTLRTLMARSFSPQTCLDVRNTGAFGATGTTSVRTLFSEYSSWGPQLLEAQQENPDAVDAEIANLIGLQRRYAGQMAPGLHRNATRSTTPDPFAAMLFVVDAADAVCEHSVADEQTEELAAVWTTMFDRLGELEDAPAAALESARTLLAAAVGPGDCATADADGVLTLMGTEAARDLVAGWETYGPELLEFHAAHPDQVDPVLADVVAQATAVANR